jgi:hypothetical protein
MLMNGAAVGRGVEGRLKWRHQRIPWQNTREKVTDHYRMTWDISLPRPLSRITGPSPSLVFAFQVYLSTRNSETILVNTYKTRSDGRET